MARGDGGVRDLPVIEGKYLGPDDLAGFVALAGDNQGIAPIQVGNGGGDGVAAIADLKRARRRVHDRPAPRP